MSEVPTCVLLRGLTRERRHWDGFPERLGRALGLPGVVALDLPGCGVRFRERSPHDIKAMVEDCRQQLHDAGVTGPLLVVALSLGGMVATAWATMAPRELSGVALINTSLRPFSPFYQRLRPGVYVALLQLLARRPGAREWERCVLALTSCQTERTEQILERWSALHAQCPVSTANALRQLWAATRYRAPLECPATPILVLSSAADDLVDPRCSSALARQWSRPQAVHPWAGHDLPLDDGAWVAEQIAHWWRGIVAVERDRRPGGVPANRPDTPPPSR